MLSINFTKRNKGDRKEGAVKGVYYNGKQPSVSIFVEAIAFEKIYREVGASAVFSLLGEGVKLDAMVQDISYDPVKNMPTHIDFKIIEKGAKILAHIPLNFVGVSEAVKSLGGTLVKVMHEVSVEADAAHLPHEINIDLSTLSALDSVITVADIALPSGVTLHHMHTEDVIVSVAVAKEEDLSAPVSSADLSTIGNAVEKGKKEEVAE